jgi:putative hemin transport protein
METTIETLKARWDKFREENPKVRIRDAAKQLGVSEAELLATGIGENVVRLQAQWVTLFKELPSLGRVMALTRNEGCILEHKGPFEKIGAHGEPNAEVATVIGSYIEQRVFFRDWTFGFAAETPTNKGPQKNLQFFDKSGEAIMKIYLQEDGGNLEAYNALVEKYKAVEQQGDLSLEVKKYDEVKYATDVDAEAFRKSWSEMKDTHDFFGMLRRYNVNRLDAMKLAGTEYAQEFDKNKILPVLEKASADQTPIMIFVGNRGNIQIHQDVVKTVKVLDKWWNVLDPNFNMHLDSTSIKSAWVVRKPTNDGVVTSFECFDEKGEMVVQFFGLRKPGKPELEEWKALAASVLA